MTKVAVVLAPGFEEIEAVTPIDVFRRAELDVDIVGFEEEVTGNHNITIKADKLLDDDLVNYDLIVLPGGLPGATNLRDNETVINALKKANEANKPIAAICAAPIVLEHAGLLKDKKFTNFPGHEKDITSGSHQPDMCVVVDGNIITSRGPGTALEFAYQILEELGIDSEEHREKMQYNKLMEFFQ